MRRDFELSFVSGSGPRQPLGPATAQALTVPKRPGSDFPSDGMIEDDRFSDRTGRIAVFMSIPIHPPIYSPWHLFPLVTSITSFSNLHEPANPSFQLHSACHRGVLIEH
ncbi:hypothetical protein V2G26_013674 [Clonostachys chloroleuca]